MWQSKQERFIADKLGLTFRPDRNLSIHCPFHEDTNESASINFNKKLFNCFKSACVGGLHLDQLEKLLKNGSSPLKETNETSHNGKKKESFRLDEIPNIEQIGTEYLKGRKIDVDNIPIAWEVPTDRVFADGEYNTSYGYVLFQCPETEYITGRNFIEKGKRFKYNNEPNAKGLFWVSKDSNNKVVYMVEGIFDGLTLYQMGIRNICCVNGCKLPKDAAPQIAYSLRGYTVLIIFDNDHDGFIGARTIADKLKEFEVDHYIVPFPRQLGNDINEAYCKQQDLLERWINDIQDRFSPDDTKYSHRLFRGKDTPPLNILPTGIKPLDKLLTGGFKDGGHVISGETGVGKTSLILNLAIKAALVGKRVMVNSCEISKRQTWSRLASNKSKFTWEELEENPHLLEDKIVKWINKISTNILVVNGWPLSRILQEADNFDIIMIDYLQRARENYSTDPSAGRHLINNYVASLTDLGALSGKICIMISSLNREAYGNPDSFGIKESGSVEYMATTVSRISPIGNVDHPTKFIWRLQKNNRGDKGMVRLSDVDLGHIDFSAVRGELLNDLDEGE